MRKKNVAKAVLVYIVTRGGVFIGDAPKGKQTLLYPLPDTKNPGTKSDAFNGTLYNAGNTGRMFYYLDTNKQWWLVEGHAGNFEMTSDDISTWSAKIVLADNAYGFTQGYQTGEFSSEASALDGIDKLAMQHRLRKGGGFPWWLLLVGALAYKHRRR